ncbi:Putative two-component sensor histidine kinase, classical system [Magnetospirillum molischianum DSM 120]|uniref:histidine kinase n=2 Tax=Magnetospirillum molischianum TaxID=1083 RepID=H8FVN6_MAGML|nr:Putative two-component sensor histidine kinase, classical system [Magnetospirillum molischianum DSM 120]
MVVIAVAVLTSLVAWIAVALWLAEDYRNTWRDRRDGLDRMSQVAAEHVRRLVSLTDLFLDSLEQSAQGPMAPDPVAATRFMKILGDDDCIVPFAVIGHDGVLRMLSGHREIQVGDRPYLKDAQPGRIVVSSPIQSRINGKWVIPLVRKVADPSSPAAMTLTAIDIGALEQMYNRFRVKNGGAITLMRSDGLVLARSPHLPGAVGRVLDDNQTFRLFVDNPTRGTVTETSPLDGLPRTASFSMIKPYGLVLAVSLSNQEIMAPWWRRVWFGIFILLAVSGVILGGTLLVLRLLSRLEREAQGLEHRVEERTRDLRRMMDRRRVFLASLSHELRSPLNVILGFSDALMGGLHGRLTPGQHGYLADIHRSGGLLLDLVNDLLDSAAIEAGSLRLEVSALDLADLFHEVEAMISQQAETAGITVTVQVDPPGLKLWADRRRLLQVLLNLGTNAVKYGGNGCQVNIAASITVDQECQITVTDNGRGMSEEEATLALTPFGRANNVGSIEGTGLGLPLSAGICALHNGSLTVFSRIGEGTRVEIILPPSRVILPDESTSPPARVLANVG